MYKVFSITWYFIQVEDNLVVLQLFILENLFKFDLGKYCFYIAHYHNHVSLILLVLVIYLYC